MNYRLTPTGDSLKIRHLTQSSSQFLIKMFNCFFKINTNFLLCQQKIFICLKKRRFCSFLLPLTVSKQLCFFHEKFSSLFFANISLYSFIFWDKSLIFVAHVSISESLSFKSFLVSSIPSLSATNKASSESEI